MKGFGSKGRGGARWLRRVVLVNYEGVWEKGVSKGRWPYRIVD